MQDLDFYAYSKGNSGDSGYYFENRLNTHVLKERKQAIDVGKYFYINFWPITKHEPSVVWFIHDIWGLPMMISGIEMNLCAEIRLFSSAKPNKIKKMYQILDDTPQSTIKVGDLIKLRDVVWVIIGIGITKSSNNEQRQRPKRQDSTAG